MKKYARIEGGTVVELIEPMIDEAGKEIEIGKRFHPDVVAATVEVTDGVNVEPGFIFADNLFTPPPDPAAPTLTALKTAKLAEINAKSQEFVDAITAGYPTFEIETWGKQEAEARAWKADATAATPVIDRMAARRKIDRVDYLGRTYSKSVAFELVYDVVGDRQMYVDKVTAIPNTDNATNRNKVTAIVPVFPAPSE